jgi:23S rRNA (uracil1939-C5)-methyltransferase
MNKTHLTITSIGAKGDGVAEYNGNPVFVDGGLMEEEVDVSILPPKGGVSRGKLLNVLMPSPDRQNAPCKHYEACGGCALQHMKTDAYQSWKFEKIKTTLSKKKIDPIQWLKPVFIDGYVRRRATFSYLKNGKKVIFGYHKKRSNQILPISTCHLLLPEMIEVKNSLEGALSLFIPDRGAGDVFIQKVDNGYDVTWTGALGKCEEPDLPVLEAIADIVNKTPIIRFSWRGRDKDVPQVMVEREKPVVVFGDLRVPLSPLAFLQPSVEGQNALVNAVKSLCSHDASRMVDLFSGCGTFTGGLLGKCAHIDAFESGDDAIQSLKKSGHKNAYKRDLFRDPLNEKELSVYDAVVIDPPRAGALEQVKMIAKSDVPAVISVSCNPTTFARDARVLMDGGYELQSLQMVDQFIWSDHAELVGLFIQK